MDNVNQPPGQPPHDPSSTQPFRFTPGWPGQAQGYGQGPAYGQGPGYGRPPWAPQQPGGAGPRRPRRRGRLLRWAGGIAAVALLAAGGTVAGLKLAGNSASTISANDAKAVALNNALSSSGAPGSGCRLAANSTSSGSQARAGHCHRLHLLRLVRGMYGEVAFHGPNGTVMLAFERGTVQSASGGQLVVRAASGTTWTWNLAGNSVIRSHGKTVPSSALSSGTRVFVAGPVSGSAKDARLVIIRAANGSKPGSSSSQSSASSSPA